jgi:peptidoglycan hydrolase-like protein with peptidoglycan-binding domain
VPTTDLSSHAPWLESQRRSRARRFAAARRLRRLRGRRSLVAVTLASLSLAGGALAAGGSIGTQAVHSAGSTVVALQQALGISADGIYGPQTRRAVRAYQANHGLLVDGVAGPQTLGSLGLASSGGASASPSSSSSSSSSASAVLERIARCESGGDPTTDTGNGYYGKYQFSLATWHRMGGTGNPAQASEALQDQLAAKLYAQAGTAPWPVCGG